MGVGYEFQVFRLAHPIHPVRLRQQLTNVSLTIRRLSIANAEFALGLLFEDGSKKIHRHSILGAQVHINKRISFGIDFKGYERGNIWTGFGLVKF